jgi:TRAP-type C4-dicarboxylate transport system permease small subunit
MRKIGSVPIFLSRLFGYLAALFLAAMMLLTVADVALRALASFPIRGILELIELGLACTIFVALPAVFLRDEHLVVDVIDHLAPRGLVSLLDLAGAVVSLAALVVMAWQMIPLAKAMYEFGDVSSDLSIPRIYYWAPVLLGVVASAAATLWFIVRWRRKP